MNWKRSCAFAPSPSSRVSTAGNICCACARFERKTLPRSPRRLRRPSDEACYHRHGGSCRPRQDRARQGAHGRGHRPAGRGEKARHHDRPRLCAPRLSGRELCEHRRCAGAREVHQEHARRRGRCRPCDACRGGGRGLHAADSRASGHPAAARCEGRTHRADKDRLSRRGLAEHARRGRQKPRQGHVFRG